MTNIKPGMIVQALDSPNTSYQVHAVIKEKLYLHGWMEPLDVNDYEQREDNKNTWSYSTRRALALREIADFIDAHPEVTVSHITAYATPARVDFFPSDEAEMRTIIKALGNVEKVKGLRGVMFRKTTDFVAYECESADGVCTQVVVGKKTATVRKVVTEAVYEDVEEEVDILEWECPESALSPEA